MPGVGIPANSDSWYSEMLEHRAWGRGEGVESLRDAPPPLNERAKRPWGPLGGDSATWYLRHSGGITHCYESQSPKSASCSSSSIPLDLRQDWRGGEEQEQYQMMPWGTPNLFDLDSKLVLFLPLSSLSHHHHELKTILWHCRLL